MLTTEEKTCGGTVSASAPLSNTSLVKSLVDAKHATQVIIVFPKQLLNDGACFSNGQQGTQQTSSSSSSVISTVTMEPSLNVRTRRSHAPQWDYFDENQNECQSSQQHCTSKYQDQTQFEPDKMDDDDNDGECSVSRSFVRDVATSARYEI
jgi:hypothetical protein